MRRNDKLFFIVLTLIILCSFDSISGAPTQREIQDGFTEVSRFDFGKNHIGLLKVEKYINETHENPELRNFIEKELVKLLESDATLAVKQFACRKLFIIGTKTSVSILLKMVVSDDAPLAETSCYALLSNPSSSVKKGLRDALKKAKGNGLAAIIKLLGEMRDNESVVLLGSLTGSKNNIVSFAAIRALGQIATKEAINKLEEFKNHDKAASALLHAAGISAGKGDISEAEKIYKRISSMKVSDHIRRGAFIGRVDLAGSYAGSLVIQTLKGKDDVLKATAISIVPRIKDKKFTSQCIDVLEKLSVSYKVLLIKALAARNDISALPILIKLSENAKLPVRIAVIQSLGKMGDKSSLPVLFKLLSDNDPDISLSAEQSLRMIRVEAIEEEIIKRAKSADNEIKLKLIRIINDRKYKKAIPLLLQEAQSPDPALSREAFRGLKTLAGKKDLPTLINILLKQKDENLRSYAEQTVAAVARRTKEIDNIISALESSKDITARSSLLRVLGLSGDQKAYDYIEKASQDKNDKIEDTAIRILADWPNTLAEEKLLKIIQKSKNEKHHILAFRGYVRLLRKFTTARGETVNKYRKIIPFARNKHQIRMVLSGLTEVPAAGALKNSLPFINDKEVSPEACLACVKICESLKKNAKNYTSIIDAMQKVIAVSKDKRVIKDSNRILNEVVKKQKQGINNEKKDKIVKVDLNYKYKPNPKEDPAFFTGKDLSGWKDYNDSSLWQVENGAIKGHSAEKIIGNRFLWSSVEVKDFYLSLDVKLLPSTANAGIQFRSKKIEEKGQALGYQADMGPGVWGKLYHEHGRKKLDWTDRGSKAVKEEEWNQYEILAVGPYIWTAINNQLSVSCYDPEGERSGYIAFQVHNGNPQTVYYRIKKFIRNPELKIAGMKKDALLKELVPVGRDVPQKRKKIKIRK